MGHKERDLQLPPTKKLLGQLRLVDLVAKFFGIGLQCSNALHEATPDIT